MAIIYTSSTGLLCKEFSCKGNGKIERISHASFWEGYATPVDIRSADDLARVIKSLSRNQCIGLGSFTGTGTVEVRLSRQDLLQNQISRTNRYIRHRPNVIPLLLDVDAKDLPPEVERRIEEAGGLLAAVDECIGSLDRYEHVISPSSSAWVAGSDSTGLHIYLFIADGTQSKRTLEELQLIAWEKGFGWIKIAKDGNLLVRSLFDTAVHGAERLIFEAEPIIHPPLEKEPQHLKINQGELFAPPLVDVRRRERILAKIRAAKVTKKPVSDRTKEDWVRRQADRHGVSVDEFRGFYRREGRLPDTLTLPDGRTLGEVLDESERTGKLINLPDPFFPEKGDGKAAVLPKNERYPDPCLFCFPAGGRVYRFERYACRTMPPKFPQKGISRNEGVINLKAGFHDAAKRRVLISGTQGIGKTHLAIKEMSKFDGVVACFAPSHTNADELRQKFSPDVRVEVVYGRKQYYMFKNIRAVENARHRQDSTCYQRDVEVRGHCRLFCPLTRQRKRAPERVQRRCACRSHPWAETGGHVQEHPGCRESDREREGHPEGCMRDMSFS